MSTIQETFTSRLIILAKKRTMILPGQSPKHCDGKISFFVINKNFVLKVSDESVAYLIYIEELFESWTQLFDGFVDKIEL